MLNFKGLGANVAELTFIFKWPQPRSRCSHSHETCSRHRTGYSWTWKTETGMLARYTLPDCLSVILICGGGLREIRQNCFEPKEWTVMQEHDKVVWQQPAKYNVTKRVRPCSKERRQKYTQCLHKRSNCWKLEAIRQFRAPSETAREREMAQILEIIAPKLEVSGTTRIDETQPSPPRCARHVLEGD